MRSVRRFFGIALMLSVLCVGCSLHGYWFIVGREPGPLTESEKAKVRQDLSQCQHYAVISRYNANKCMVEKGYEWIKGTPPEESYDPLK
jgi:hypothetical protein